MLRLILLVGLESKFADLGLAARTFLPTNLRTLVAAHMDIFRREEVADLREDILKELHGLFLTYAKHIVRDSPIAPHAVRTACAAEFRISGECCEHMTGKVDLRNDGNALGCCVFNDFSDLVL